MIRDAMRLMRICILYSSLSKDWGECGIMGLDDDNDCMMIDLSDEEIIERICKDDPAI